MAELIRINKSDFNSIIADHADELDFHANLTFRAINSEEWQKCAQPNRCRRPLCRKIGLAETHSHHSFKGDSVENLGQLYRVLDAKYFDNGAIIYNVGSQPFFVRDCARFHRIDRPRPR